MWFVVRNIILSSPEATPSKALRKPENVTEDWYLRQNRKRHESRPPDRRAYFRPCENSGHIPVFAGLDPFVKRRVDVFYEDYAPFWSI